MFKLIKNTALVGLCCLAWSGAHAAISSSEEDAIRKILQCVEKIDDTLVISGCDLQVTNGLNNTQLTNGLGNLIIGYNSDASLDNERTGSHNLIVGENHSYRLSGSLITGAGNFALGQSVVVAGSNNKATGFRSVILGGVGHEANGWFSSILGGTGATTGNNARWSTVAGGQFNTANGFWSSVTGGHNNQANGDLSTITGGEDNRAEGPSSTIVGGKNNITGSDGRAAALLGGRDNQANGEASTIGGGQNRSVSGLDDYRAGYFFAGE
ncbi:hypothetical protein HR060_11555 [Catenovulum sp. SM1970]|uniref:hypothetical protein n=1 Tax=Marinifaba aquimaris TaxID=2741323 RepID=UPI0015735870|nr:hypothetical protein [Marinifaba aquimaris]NTS77498.1 hypothetical protein [Marinifaba aquimaris]